MVPNRKTAKSHKTEKRVHHNPADEESRHSRSRPRSFQRRLVSTAGHDLAVVDFGVGWSFDVQDTG
jgi:hypothetical protein